MQSIWEIDFVTLESTHVIIYDDLAKIADDILQVTFIGLQFSALLRLCT